jgi:hypothetical protein
MDHAEKARYSQAFYQAVIQQDLSFKRAEEFAA